MFGDSQWSSDSLEHWPLVNLSGIFSFLLKSKDFKGDIGHYKTEKAFSYFSSGFVGTISRATIPDKEEMEKHQPWILSKDNGEIIAAWCTCTAGFRKTWNHVAACLYKVEYGICNVFLTIINYTIPIPNLYSSINLIDCFT